MLQNSVCDKTKNVTKFQNSIFENSKTQKVTKHRNSKYNKIQKLEM